MKFLRRPLKKTPVPRRQIRRQNCRIRRQLQQKTIRATELPFLVISCPGMYSFVFPADPVITLPMHLMHLFSSLMNSSCGIC